MSASRGVLINALRRTWRAAFLAILDSIAAAFLAAPPAAAQPAGAGADESEIALELKAPQDPTILKPRIWLDTEWNRYSNASDDVDITVGRVWAWPIASDQDWAVRLKVPLKWHAAGDAGGDSNKQGLGDIQVATGIAARIGQSWRAGGGLEMRLPTATDDALGANAWRAQLFATIAWDATSRITLSPSAEYNKSIAEMHEAAPQRFLEMFFPVTFILPRQWSMTPSYEVKVDFANDRRATRSAKLQLATVLKQLPLGFVLSVKKPLDESDKKFQINFMITRYFR